MSVLWTQEAASVRKVLKGLSGEPVLAYTTIQTMMTVLQRKGKVERRLVGRAFEYRPLLTRESADLYALRELLQEVFGGSVSELLRTLARSGHLDAHQLAKLQPEAPGKYEGRHFPATDASTRDEVPAERVSK